MRNGASWMLTCSLLAALGCQSQQRMSGYALYGAPIETDGAVSLARAIENASLYAEKPVTVQADIDAVCPKMGCWMTMTDGSEHVRVRFTASPNCADGFFVPRNAAGHRAYARGTLEIGSISEELARHYAEDQGKPAEEITEITGPQPQVSMLATGVMISDAKSLDAPVDQ